MNYYKNVPYNFMPTVKECFKAIEQRFDDAQAEINKLTEENNKLKENVYKDELVKKTMARFEEMREDYYRGFPVTKQELEAADAWIRKHNDTKHGGAQHGAIGGGYNWIFTPTGIGNFGCVECSFCKERFEFLTP